MRIIIDIKSGKHAGEPGIVVQELNSNLFKTLTLEGDIHYYDSKGNEVKPVINIQRST